MASSTLSAPRSRAIVIAGVAVAVLAPLVGPLVSALASPRPESFSTLSRIQEGVAVLDPVTGLLIHPITGLLVDLTGIVYDTALAQYVDPSTRTIIPADGSIPGLPALPVPDGPTASPQLLDDVARVVSRLLPYPAADGSGAAPSASEPSEESSVPDQSPVPDDGPGDGSPSSPGSSQVGTRPAVSMSSPASTIVSVVDLVLDDSSPLETETGEAPSAP